MCNLYLFNLLSLSALLWFPCVSQHTVKASWDLFQTLQSEKCTKFNGVHSAWSHICGDISSL